MVPNRVVTINCAGTYFQVYRDTLTRGSSYFQAYFTGGFSESLDSEVAEVDVVAPNPAAAYPQRHYDVFLDMNPRFFELLLDRMRYGLEYDLPGPGDRNGLRQAAEFLGVEYRNAKEIQHDQEELQKCEKESLEQTRLRQLKEAGLVDFLVMCTDVMGRICLARVIDEDRSRYLIQGSTFDEWIAKDSPRISRNLQQRCDCRGTACPNSGYSVFNIANPTSTVAIGWNAGTHHTAGIGTCYMTRAGSQ